MKILAISGYSGSGKTTLLKKLIPKLKSYGIALAVIKHSHHNMDIDLPGKDSYELRAAGAQQIIVACDARWALIKETPNLPFNITQLSEQFSAVDLVLVEGFKGESLAKISCYRQAIDKPFYQDEYTLAIVSDTPQTTHLPQFDINDIDQISLFIVAYLKVSP